MTYRTRFLAASGAWTAAVAAALLAGTLAVRDRVPDPVASHWGASGEPDGSMSLTGSTWVNVGLWLVIAVAGMAIGASGWRRRVNRAAAVATLAGGAVFSAGLVASTLWANLDAVEWQQAKALPFWHVLLLLATTALAGWLGWFAGNRGPDERAEPAEGVAELRLKPGQRAVWVSSVRNRPMQVVGVVALLVGVALVVLQLPVAAVAPLLAGVPVFVVSSARVQVDEHGVHASFGPLRWPVRRIRLEQIEDASVETRRALEVGGWGYRVLPTSTAIMLRGGECLALRLTSGRKFYISVDNPERGAELVNALITERSAL
ncbi:Protein of unknown function [Saccharopolyspora antimicrobica]|uniref:Uncharacterized protein DUF1648 n=1 Tax=Saccharopolyspora antimicrobica TaxID=455193 RepID=A0A1I4T7T0_9PSEU|nr:DUF1648 domain-containing protein [Saccharopolyspora antimicrobica]RKT85828.1 uncharacterized protein DUF1648 [Saccharopolyspora antimicrobica]SFM72681.1 Protein of unknown function [Saccharopolyspora antimicrobica]